MASICLNMIVRNEGRTIRRLLDSVRNLVDQYVIVDTGSTDDTMQQIKDYPLCGILVEQPFVDFGVSRTFALQQARLHSQCRYLLLLDADMQIELLKPLPLLTADAYYIFQSQGALVYPNIRLVRREMNVICKGATHEYYDLPPNIRVEYLNRDTVRIVDVGDGGCKADKYSRDLRLLREAHHHHPQDPRTVFYLAQTLYDTQQYGDAMNMYMHRIALGGWDQEVFYSKFRIALCFLALNQMQNAQIWAQMSHDYALSLHVPRAEPFFHLSRRLREQGQHALAYAYLVQVLNVPKPTHDGSLFVEEDVYDYLILVEQSILWFYLYPTMLSAGADICTHVLDIHAIPAEVRQCVMSNLKFYMRPMSLHPAASGPERVYPDECLDEERVWRYSSVGFMEDGTTFARLVNYFIQDDGSYYLCQDKVASRLIFNDVVIHDVVNQTPWHQKEAPVLGLEDSRILETSDAIYTLSASMEFARDKGKISQVLGQLDLHRRQHTVIAVIRSPFEETHEKNWVFAGSLTKVIYRWHPSIWIGRLDAATETLVHAHSVPVPGSFEGMRGSTNGVLYRNQWWFVTHYVVANAGKPRTYLHRLVVLDYDLTSVQATSRPFVFGKDADIEYCLGFRISPRGTATFGYSARDRFPCKLQVPLYAFTMSWLADEAGQRAPPRD